MPRLHFAPPWTSSADHVLPVVECGRGGAADVAEGGTDRNRPLHGPSTSLAGFSSGPINTAEVAQDFCAELANSSRNDFRNDYAEEHLPRSCFLGRGATK